MARIVLYLVPPENYFESVVRIFKTCLKGHRVTYVTANKPYATLSAMFKKAKIRPEGIFFIDCVTRETSPHQVHEPDNCIMIDSPKNLTAIGISISKSMAYIPGKKALFLDSLSTLLIYHDAGVIARFSSFIINQMRLECIDFCIIALSSDMDKDVISKISSFVDKVEHWGA